MQAENTRLSDKVQTLQDSLERTGEDLHSAMGLSFTIDECPLSPELGNKAILRQSSWTEAGTGGM